MEIVICYAKEFRYTQKEHFADSTKGTACAHAAQYVIDNNLDPFCTFFIREHGAWVEGNASWALMFADALEALGYGHMQQEFIDARLVDIK